MYISDHINVTKNYFRRKGVYKKIKMEIIIPTKNALGVIIILSNNLSIRNKSIKKTYHIPIKFALIFKQTKLTS